MATRRPQVFDVEVVDVVILVVEPSSPRHVGGV
jgi:hypothetical protein